MTAGRKKLFGFVHIYLLNILCIYIVPYLLYEHKLICNNLKVFAYYCTPHNGC